MSCMSTTTLAPRRPKRSAPCAWCGVDFPTLLDLLTHVDDSHLEVAPARSRAAFPAPAPAPVPALASAAASGAASVAASGAASVAASGAASVAGPRAA